MPQQVAHRRHSSSTHPFQRQRLQRGNRVRTPPLPNPRDLGFHPRGGEERSGRCTLTMPPRRGTAHRVIVVMTPSVRGFPRSGLPTPPPQRGSRTGERRDQTRGGGSRASSQPLSSDLRQRSTETSTWRPASFAFLPPTRPKRMVHSTGERPCRRRRALTPRSPP
jgi:hypothetical protein